MEAAQGVKRPHPENGDAEGDGAKKRFQSANGVSDNSGASEFGGEIKESENGGGRGSRGNFRGAGDFSSRRESNAGSNYSSSSKVYSDFPDWHADKIHDVLESFHDGQYPRTEPDWTILNTLKKEVNPTFKTVLHYIKKMLLSATHKGKVEGLPRQPVTLVNAFKEKANLSQLDWEDILRMFYISMSPSERCPYYLHHFEKMNAFELEWFNYYKEKPEKFQDQCKVYKLNKYRNFGFNS
ncbi:hypothetical protein R5R35_001133 [Gryllus longicercus]|uniref:Uncharacterized protein n=1 Tax=Gryllus longicercus TaxID=2509291 RepID=A0AAN9ZBG9_9ORTH